MAAKDKGAAPNCAKCGRMVHEKAMIAEGKVYHTYHFQCTKCNKVIPAEYAVHNGAVYCMTCHQGLMQAPCSKCAKAIDGPCFEVFGKRFHKNCLQCAFCNQVLNDGVFYPVGEEIFCLQHVLQAQAKSKQKDQK